jgi:hypothetical protein
MGGQFFNFGDASGAAGLVFAGGAGVERRLWDAWVLRVEVSADFYRARFVTYSQAGSIVSASETETYATGTVAAGLAYRF